MAARIEQRTGFPVIADEHVVEAVLAQLGGVWRRVAELAALDPVTPDLLEPRTRAVDEDY